MKGPDTIWPGAVKPLPIITPVAVIPCVGVHKISGTWSQNLYHSIWLVYYTYDLTKL